MYFISQVSTLEFQPFFCPSLISGGRSSLVRLPARAYPPSYRSHVRVRSSWTARRSVRIERPLGMGEGARMYLITELGKGGCMKMLNRGSFADVIYRWSPEAESNECSDATTAQKESKRGKGGGGTLGRDGLSNDASYHRCIGTPKIIACRPYFVRS